MFAKSGYRIAMSLGVPLASLVLRRPELRRAHLGRLEAVARLEQWAARQRDPGRPLAWFHAASVGESLQARAVIAELRRIRPDCQVVATRFSASAERIAESMGADFTGYLPYDRVGDVRRALAALQPDLLVFSKLDVWPELASQASESGVGVALVAGSVDPGSARLGSMSRHFTRRGYEAIDLAAVISEQDGDRLVRLGTPAERILVAGDPRVNSVLESVEQLRPRWPADPDPSLMVAGSTWPADEAHLLAALRIIRDSGTDARLLVVPHEPVADRIAGIVASAAGFGMKCTRWQRDGGSGEAVQYVDQV
ncbi:MAG TPA: glycosyltransferase N-terminal domain-containing protein, partial [Gemmatimonadales bacterium]|nr:glycosyltransferase N-terminal domain-containing protein [Gemmatimonadales bacterium]